MLLLFILGPFRAGGGTVASTSRTKPDSLVEVSFKKDNGIILVRSSRIADICCNLAFWDVFVLFWSILLLDEPSWLLFTDLLPLLILVLSALYSFMAIFKSFLFTLSEAMLVKVWGEGWPSSSEAFLFVGTKSAAFFPAGSLKNIWE